MRPRLLATSLVIGIAVHSVMVLAQNQPEVDALKARTFHVALNDSVAFLSVTAGLRIVDMSDVASPREMSTLVLPQSANASVVDGSVAYVAQGAEGVVVVDVSDLAAPLVTSRIDTRGSAMMVDLSAQVLAIADGSLGVLLHDVSNPEEPRELWKSQDMGYVRGVRFSGATLYACAGETGLVAITTKGKEHEAAGQCATGGDARDVDFYRRFAFVADGKFGVSIVDISEAGEPRLLGTFPTADLAHGVAFHKGYVFVADGLEGVAVFKFDKPGTLEQILTLDALGGYANKVTTFRRKLYVANDFKGLLVFDIHDPKRPLIVR